MNTTQIALVQASFAKVAPIAAAAAEMFYKRLFELDPPLSKLFRGDMTEQGAKLMAMMWAMASLSTGSSVRGSSTALASHSSNVRLPRRRWW